MSDVREFRAILRSLVRALDDSLQAKTDRSGVTTAQCHLLLEIAERGEGSIGEYADRMALDQSTLSRTVDNLVKLGFVEREPDPDNRRRQLVDLSKTGKKKAESINALCDEEYGRVLARIPAAKCKSLLDGLGLLVSALRAEGPFGGESGGAQEARS
jgi:DNA-binding MarR family transcriptional regulator